MSCYFQLSSKDIHPLYLNLVRKYLPLEETKLDISLKLEPFGLHQGNTVKAVQCIKSEVCYFFINI